MDGDMDMDNEEEIPKFNMEEFIETFNANNDQIEVINIINSRFLLKCSLILMTIYQYQLLKIKAIILISLI